MSALLRRRHRLPTVIEYTLGHSSLASVAATVVKLLRDPDENIVVKVVGFDYFDEQDLTAISDLASWSPRVEVVGLDAFADMLLPPASVIDVRSMAERALTRLSSVAVVTVLVDGQPLTDHEFEDALQLALSAGPDILTVDLRHLAQLTPAQVLAIAEASAELHRQSRTLILVNTTTAVAHQLRRGGLSGALRMTADELI